jgi:hypothetical protein
MPALTRRAVNWLSQTVKQDFSTEFDAALAKSGQPKEDQNPVLYRFKVGGTEKVLRASDLTPEGLTQLGKLQESAEKLEAVLVKQVLAAMEQASQSSSGKEGMGGMGHDLYVEQISQEMASTGSVGLAKIISQQLSKAFVSSEAAKLVASQTEVKK